MEYPLPSWQRDINKTKQFHDWVNGMYPGTIKMNADTRRLAPFGPQTKAAWDKYGETYTKIYNASNNKAPASTMQSPIPKIQVPAGLLEPISGGGPSLAGAINKSIASSWDMGIGKKSETSIASRTGTFLSKAGDVANKVAPFASNIINAFRKPPMPSKGVPYTYNALQKVDMSDERYKVSSSIQAANRASERNVDGNTAEAIKAFNRGEEFSRLSTINEREKNTNIAISNEQAKMDAGVTAANTGLVNKYRDELVGREVAHQREQSANVANAGDKAMMIRNETMKSKTELAKAGVLKTLYDKSGVLKRDNAIGQQWKTAGIPDPFGEDYKWLDEKKDKAMYGGYLKKLPKKIVA